MLLEQSVQSLSQYLTSAEYMFSATCNSQDECQQASARAYYTPFLIVNLYVTPIEFCVYL